MWCEYLIEFCLQAAAWFTLFSALKNICKCTHRIEELLTRCLERLETDYNPKSSGVNVVAEVMCALVLSRAGLSENEISNMFQISDQTWSPLYFALDKYLVKRLGLLG